MSLDQRIIKMITNHPEGDMNVMNPSNSCQDSLIKATSFKFMVVLELKDYRSQEDSSSEDHDCLYKI